MPCDTQHHATVEDCVMALLTNIHSKTLLATKENIGWALVTPIHYIQRAK